MGSCQLIEKQIITTFEFELIDLGNSFTLFYRRVKGTNRKQFVYKIYHNDVVDKIIQNPKFNLPKNYIMNDRWGKLDPIVAEYNNSFWNFTEFKPTVFGQVPPKEYELIFLSYTNDGIFDKNYKPKQQILQWAVNAGLQPKRHDMLESVARIDTRVRQLHSNVFSHTGFSIFEIDIEDEDEYCRLLLDSKIEEAWLVSGLFQDHGSLVEG